MILDVEAVRLHVEPSIWRRFTDEEIVAVLALTNAAFGGGEPRDARELRDRALYAGDRLYQRIPPR